MKCSLVGYVEIFGDTDDVFVLKEINQKVVGRGILSRSVFHLFLLCSANTKTSSFRSD